MGSIYILAFLTIWSVLACVVDIKKQIIPKWITIPLFLTGLFYHAHYNGFPGAFSAILASLLYTLLIYFVESIDTMVNPTAKTVLGGGDYKLSLATGAWVGIEHFTILAFFYFLFYAVLRMCIYLRAKIKAGKGIIKNIVFDLREEIYGPGTPCRVAYAPYIACPFLLTIFHLYFGR